MRSRLFLWLFILIVAPIATIVLISVLLLFGVHPPIVFAPGNAVRSVLESAGRHLPNAVAVASTAAIYWAAIVAAGLLWDRRRR